MQHFIGAFVLLMGLLVLVFTERITREGEQAGRNPLAQRRKSPSSSGWWGVLLAGDRDEAQVRAEIAERELAEASAKLVEAGLRITELEDANEVKDQTISRLIVFLNRMRARNDDIVERVRHLQAV